MGPWSRAQPRRTTAQCHLRALPRQGSPRGSTGALGAAGRNCWALLEPGVAASPWDVGVLDLRLGVPAFSTCQSRAGGGSHRTLLLLEGGLLRPPASWSLVPSPEPSGAAGDMGWGSNRTGVQQDRGPPHPPGITPHPCGFRAVGKRAPRAAAHVRTVGTSLLRDGDALLEEAMEVGLSGTASFLPSGSFSTPFSRDE